MAVLSLGIMGCQQAQEQPAEQAETEMHETMPMEEEMAMVDPVCGMEVTEDSEWTAEYEGETYYFCSETCRDEFMADPMKYTEQMMEEEGSDM
jgi:YHS domain-containing protein